MHRNCGWATLDMTSSTSLETDLLIDVVLARVANHMTHLAETLAITETAVSDHFNEVLANDTNMFKDVQNLDYLHQSMTDTATLLSYLSSGCRKQTEFVDSLKLETTRALVRGKQIQTSTHQSGNIDLF